MQTVGRRVLLLRPDPTNHQPVRHSSRVSRTTVSHRPALMLEQANGEKFLFVTTLRKPKWELQLIIGQRPDCLISGKERSQFRDETAPTAVPQWPVRKDLPMNFPPCERVKNRPAARPEKQPGTQVAYHLL